MIIFAVIIIHFRKKHNSVPMEIKRLRLIMATAALPVLAAASFTASADEGMWLPSLISERIGDMQEKGFRLDAEDIYSINQASLKDAVVLFGRGCTGEVISPEGLLLTNHHCGYGQIQKHSSVEHDYLRDGFWAMSRDEEKRWRTSQAGSWTDTPQT